MLHELVKVVLAKDVRRTIADYKVDAAFSPSEDLLYLIHCLLSCDISLQKSRTLNRCHFKEIDGDQVRLCQYVHSVFAQPLCYDLRPTARGSTKVDHFADVGEDVESLINLEKFVGAAGPVPLLLGLAIVYVAFVFCSFSH